MSTCIARLGWYQLAGSPDVTAAICEQMWKIVHERFPDYSVPRLEQSWISWRCGEEGITVSSAAEYQTDLERNVCWADETELNLALIQILSNTCSWDSAHWIKFQSLTYVAACVATLVSVQCFRISSSMGPLLFGSRFITQSLICRCSYLALMYIKCLQHCAPMLIESTLVSDLTPPDSPKVMDMRLFIKHTYY